jgi:hypothetical protein
MSANHRVNRLVPGLIVVILMGAGLWAWGQNLTVTGTTTGQGAASFATSSGSVGVGTAAPYGKFTVVGPSMLTDYTGSYNNHFPAADNNTYVTGANVYLRGGAPQGWRIDMAVLGNGSVGIGTTSPQNYIGWPGSLEVNGMAKAAIYYDDDPSFYADLNSGGRLGGAWSFTGPIYPAYVSVTPQNNATGEGGEIQLQGAGGRLPYQIDVYNNDFRVHRNGIELVKIGPNGWVQIAGGLVQNSSAAFKKDIHFLDEKELAGAVALLEKTPVATYRYKAASATSQAAWGVIAERTPAPLLGEDGKSVSLSNTIGVLMAAVKSQQQELRAQRAELAELRAELARLRTRSGR